MLQIPSAESATALAVKPVPTEAAPVIKNKALELAAPTETTVTDTTEVGSQAKSEPTNNNTPLAIASSPTTGNNDFLALQTKITALEQQLSMMQQLLALKDQQLAILQNANKNQFAQANPVAVKAELEQPSLLLIASLGLSLLTGLGWLLWHKNQREQRRKSDDESFFDNDFLAPTATNNDTFSFSEVASTTQSSTTNNGDFDFDLGFFEAPVAPILVNTPADQDDAEWHEDDENETKIDLAKAYIDMGDLEMAKIIAEEVIKTGNKQQKLIAQALLTEL
jgi:FimV-like protein